MGKWWSILFAVVMLGCALSMVVAPLVGIWLPEGVSTHAWDVDKLFYFILAVTTFFFLLTEGLLVWFMWKYAGRYDPAKAKEVLEADLATQPPEPMETLQPTWFGRLMRPVLRVLNDQHRVEMAWTLVPAIILLYIAFAQVGAWVEIKYRSRMPNRELDEASAGAGEAKGEGADSANQVEIVAHQFGWRMRYPHPDRVEMWRHGNWKPTLGEKESPVKRDYVSFPRVKQMTDIDVVNELHTWVGQPLVIHLSTRDVIHSFNVPVMRVKQDALPGRIIPVWFTPTKSNVRLNPMTKEYEDGYNPVTGKTDSTHIWDIACAELCGWGHYRMIGRVYVHKDYDEFLDWLRKRADAASVSK